ncbi:MAG: hypothetical protein WCS69_09800 [Ignavibacteriaceae bacterium]|jgi:hypothetical protein
MTQEEISGLITTPKKITSSTRTKFKPVNRSRRINLEAVSEDNQFRFEIFIRQSEKFEERFSIGLCYIPEKDENIVLARYNGSHGMHYNKFTDGQIFSSFHKHYATEEAFQKGIKPEHTARIANYVHFSEALLRFFKEMNFNNYRNYLEIFEIENNSLDELNLFDNQNNT